jgi:hypothetical protein
MPVKTLFNGAAYVVSAWIDNEDSCAVEDYILELYASNDSDSEAMVNRLQKTAQQGPPTNKEKFRTLSGVGQGLVEFKVRGGTRVLGFIDRERRRIVCTHGIPKLKAKRFNREMEKAQKIKEQYLIENAKEENEYVN